MLLCGTDLAGWLYGLVVGCCKHKFMFDKRQEFIDWHSVYHLLEDFFMWI
jgi:hypothetical protein